VGGTAEAGSGRCRASTPSQRALLWRDRSARVGAEEHHRRLVPRHHAHEKQLLAIRERTAPPSRTGSSIDTQWRRREEIVRIRGEAVRFAREHLDDPFFVAGVALYWAEGSKTRNDLSLPNSDARVLRTFIAWVRKYHDPSTEFVLKINLHANNDEAASRIFWATSTGLDRPTFHKTFIKPDGTGHRKNHLPHGVCQVRVRKADDAWQRTMTWIDVVASAWSVIG